MRYAAVVRSAYGLSLLLAPGAVIGVASGGTTLRISMTVGRVLGARHLVQALITGRVGTRGWLLAGAAVDATHALSMVGLAALNADHRLPAALDAVLATGLSLNGLREARNV